MDINDFGIEKEYFGFGASDRYGNTSTSSRYANRGFRQLQKSNTSFLDFTTIEETPEYQTALRKHQSLMEDLITDADKKAETDRFEKEVRNLRVQRGITGVQTGLSTFNNVLTQLGIKPTTTPTTGSTTQVNANQTGQGGKPFPWALVIGGVVVVGGVIFAIYKFRK